MPKYITLPAPPTIAEYFNVFLKDNSAFVAGGVLRTMFERIKSTNIEVSSPDELLNMLKKVDCIWEMKDIDLFFKSEEDFNKAIEKFNENSETEIYYETDNSVGLTISWDSPVLDLVRREFNNVEETLNNFDFTVSQCALYRGEDDKFYLTFSEDFLNDVFCNKLRLTDSIRYGKVEAVNPLERTLRHIRYGYMIDDQNAREILQIAIQLYPELIELSDNKKFAKKILSDEVSSQKGFKKLLNSVDPNSSNIGSFSTGYTVERGAIRSIVQQMVEPDFDSEKAIENYRKKQNSSSYMYDFSNSEAGYGTFRFLDFIDSKKDIIGNDNAEILTHFSLLYNFTVDDLFENVWCNVCKNDFKNCSYGKILLTNNREKAVLGHPQQKQLFAKTKSDPDNQIFSLRKFSENSIEVIYKAFMMNKNDDTWIRDTAQFFVEYASTVDDTRISLKNWHKFLDDGLFDPSLPPSLTLSLVG